VQAIKTISGIIDQVNQISSTIATAVEEQSATTSEMSRNLTEAAKGSGDVAQNIHGVAEAAQNTSHGATDSQKAAKSLAEMSTQLRELVGQFKVDTKRARQTRLRTGCTVSQRVSRPGVGPRKSLLPPAFGFRFPCKRRNWSSTSKWSVKFICGRSSAPTKL